MFDLLQWHLNLNLTYEDTLNVSRKWFVDSNVVETQLFLFNRSDNCDAANVKIKGNVDIVFHY